MPQFVITGLDGSDSAAPQRRLDARAAHMAHIEASLAQVKMAAALLDEAGEMVGSILTVDFTDRAALDAWLVEEPYVLQQVWHSVTVVPCRIAPLFQTKLT